MILITRGITPLSSGHVLACQEKDVNLSKWDFNLPRCKSDRKTNNNNGNDSDNLTKAGQESVKTAQTCTRASVKSIFMAISSLV